jgi:hypothetical protein
MTVVSFTKQEEETKELASEAWGPCLLFVPGAVMPGLVEMLNPYGQSE